MHSHQVPIYVKEVCKCFKKAYVEVHLQSNSEVDQCKRYYNRATSMVHLMKADTFQGKRKVKDRGAWWSVVVHQFTDDVPTYKVHDNGGRTKVVHRN